MKAVPAQAGNGWRVFIQWAKWPSYYITEADYDFWTTESNVPAQFKVFWETATKNLKPNREGMQFIKSLMQPEIGAS